MTLSANEKRTVLAVFQSLGSMKYGELNKFLGSITIEEMMKLRHKLEHEDYCDRHGIKYEDMTEEDFERAYEERYADL